MEQELKSLQQEAINDINSASNLNALNDVRVKYLGKKGSLTSILRGMGKLSPEQRPVVGQMVNLARKELETAIEAKQTTLKEAELANRLATEKIDVTLPGRRQPLGHLHPLTVTLNKMKDIFTSMGYSIAEGPQIESDYFNFEALNLPKDHPARDMQDSFYITEDILLRSQTSPVQARTMQLTNQIVQFASLLQVMYIAVMIMMLHIPQCLLKLKVFALIKTSALLTSKAHLLLSYSKSSVKM